MYSLEVVYEEIRKSMRIIPNFVVEFSRPDCKENGTVRPWFYRSPIKGYYVVTVLDRHCRLALMELYAYHNLVYLIVVNI